MEFVPKEITEEVNVTPIHPFKYFAKVGVMILFWLTVFYFVSALLADQIAKVLDPKIEASIGQSIIAPFAAFDIRPQQEQQLQELLNDLQAQVEIRLPEAEIHLVESKDINAGVLPGGQMIMTTGLLDKAESENELAFVLAHELGHHQLRHPSRRLGRSLLWMATLSVLGMGQQNTPAFNPSAPLTFADVQFTRSQEQDSDEFALDLIHKRYGHIGHALDFFRRLQDENFDPISRRLNIEFFATHPFPETRVQDLEAYAKRQGWKLEGDPQPLLIKAESD